MSKIARSDQPLYQTRNRPVCFPVDFAEPDRSVALDLTGATIVARLCWERTEKALVVEIDDPPSGEIVATGAAELTSDMPLGRLGELQITTTDSQGGTIDWVWPVIGEAL